MKKVISLVFVFMMLMSSSVFASGNEKLTLDMEVMNIETDYDKSEVYVSYDNVGDTIIATIYDNKTSKMVDRYKLLIIKEPSRLKSTGGYLTVQLTRDYNPTSHNSTKIEVYMEARLYQETISGQTVYSIIDIYETDHYAVGSGPFRSANIHTSLRSQTSKYADVNITGTLEATKSQALSVGLSFEIIEGLGFDMSAEETAEWIARLSYNDSVRFYVN